MLELPQNVEIGTASGGKTLDFLSAGTGESKITFADSQAVALSMGEGSNNYIEFDSLDGAEEVRIIKKLEATAGVEISGGTDLNFVGGASGDRLITFPDNLADGLSIDSLSTQFMTFDSTTGDERIIFHVPINANVVCEITNITNSYPMVSTDCIINYSIALDADKTITLVDPTTVPGQTVKIIRDSAGSDAFNLIIDPGAFEIDGSTADILLKKDNDHITLTSNGVNWFIV